MFHVLLLWCVVLGNVASHPMDVQLSALKDFYLSTGGPKYWPPHWTENWLRDPIKYDPCHPWMHYRGTNCLKNQIIWLSHCSSHARGYLPSSLEKLEKLVIFDVAANELSGPLPAITTWTLLTAFSAHNNAFNGTIPSTFGTMKSLRFLRLDHNRLSGTIPNEFGQMLNLEALFLDENLLSGTIPQSLQALTKLQHLRVQSNKLSGAVPQFLLQSQVMLGLELEKNTFEISRTPPINTIIRFSADWSPALSPEEEAPLRYMGIGDFGMGGDMFWSCKEVASARAFNEYATKYNTQFTFTVGDNFYNGNTPWKTLEDYFRESFEALYTCPVLMNTPWYVALGNHDSKSEFGYTKKSTRWKQPGSFFTIPNITIRGTAKMDLIIHDTINGLARKYKPIWGWLGKELTASKLRSRFTIVSGHYPIYSSACHGQLPQARDANMLFKQTKPHAYFAGHDHHLEAIYAEGMYYFLIGGFARGPCTQDNPRKETMWREREHGGFIVITQDEYLMNVTFVSQFGSFMKRVSVPYDFENVTGGKDFDMTPYVRAGIASRLNDNPNRVSVPVAVSTPPGKPSTPKSSLANVTYLLSPAQPTSATPFTLKIEAPAHYFISVRDDCNVHSMVPGTVVAGKGDSVQSPALPAGKYYVCIQTSAQDSYNVLPPTIEIRSQQVSNSEGGSKDQGFPISYVVIGAVFVVLSIGLGRRAMTK